MPAPWKRAKTQLELREASEKLRQQMVVSAERLDEFIAALSAQVTALSAQVEKLESDAEGEHDGGQRPAAR